MENTPEFKNNKLEKDIVSNMHYIFTKLFFLCHNINLTDKIKEKVDKEVFIKFCKFLMYSYRSFDQENYISTFKSIVNFNLNFIDNQRIDKDFNQISCKNIRNYSISLNKLVNCLKNTNNKTLLIFISSLIEFSSLKDNRNLKLSKDNLLQIFYKEYNSILNEEYLQIDNTSNILDKFKLTIFIKNFSKIVQNINISIKFEELGGLFDDNGCIFTTKLIREILPFISLTTSEIVDEIIFNFFLLSNKQNDIDKLKEITCFSYSKLIERISNKNEILLKCDIIRNLYNHRGHYNQLNHNNDDFELKAFNENFDFFLKNLSLKKNDSINSNEFKFLINIFIFMFNDEINVTKSIVLEWYKLLNNKTLDEFNDVILRIDQNEISFTKSFISEFSNFKEENVNFGIKDIGKNENEYRNEKQNVMSNIKENENMNERLNNTVNNYNIISDSLKEDKSNDFNKIENEEVFFDKIDIYTENSKEIIDNYSNNQCIKIKNSSNFEITIFSFKNCLKSRGIKGLMNLHKQFLVNCDIGKISRGDFLKVLILQRINFKFNDNECAILNLKNECKQIRYHFYPTSENLIESNKEFEKFSNIIFDYFTLVETSDIIEYLDFPKFINFFKKNLNFQRLSAVKKAFNKLSLATSNSLTIDSIKTLYNYFNHPRSNENLTDDLLLVEFIDSFELNYNFLASNLADENSSFINLNEFANYYEYLGFLYDCEESDEISIRNSDREFTKEIHSTWNIDDI